MTDRSVRDARFYDLAMAVRVLSTFSKEDWDSLTLEQQRQLCSAASLIVHYDFTAYVREQKEPDYCFACSQSIEESDFAAHANTLPHQRLHDQAQREHLRNLTTKEQ